MWNEFLILLQCGYLKVSNSETYCYTLYKKNFIKAIKIFLKKRPKKNKSNRLAHTHTHTHTLEKTQQYKIECSIYTYANMLILILSLLFTIILHIMTIIISENILTTHIRCFILEYIRTIVHKQFTEHTILHLRENAHQQSMIMK